MTPLHPDRRQALSLLALGAGAAAGPVEAQASTAVFAHGVASGDPAADGVILWTRVSAEGNGPVEVTWEVAADPGFARALKSGRVRTGRERDHTVKADVRGLPAGRELYYRFRAGAAVSPVGRTRTLPTGRLDELKLAVMSCSLIPAGVFNAYDHIARGPKLDAVVHLGDYIYEYGAGPGDYGVSARTPPERMPDPPHETVTLADYRRRHAQYKRDPDLQAAHAAAPWIVVWDDHEVANDTWRDGAENHQPETEGPFDPRKAAALQAYYEWMPIREPAPGRAREAIQRSFDWGDLASLIMVETRLNARSQQLRYDDPALPRTVYDASVPGERRPADAATTARVLDAVRSGAPAPAPYVVGPDLPRFEALLSAPDRQLLGAEQELWVGAEMTRSVRAGRAWQILGNQVVMGRARAPDAYRALGGEARVKALVAGLGKSAAARLLRVAELGAIGAPYNLDSWDGYPAARERLLQRIRTAGGNTVVLAGDSHSFWVNELRDAGGVRCAAEFGTSSVTSPSAGDALPQVDLGAILAAQNPEIRHCDQSNKGYIRLTFTRDLCRGELIATPVDAKPYAARVTAIWTVLPTAGPGVGEIAKIA